MTYDVAVIGAGPAGMAAAVRLSRMGLTVMVADEQPAPGGQIWRGVEKNCANGLATALGADYVKGAAAVAAFREASVDYRPLTQVWQIEDGWRLLLTCNGAAESVESRAVLLATGAQERPVPFPGWTLPGVMTVGAAQILLKTGCLLPEGPIWVAGNGPLPLLYATQALDLGGRMTGYLDTAAAPGVRAFTKLPSALRDIGSLRKGLAWMRQLRRSGCKIVRRVDSLRAEGEERLERVLWTQRGRTESAATGLLLVHEGVVPQIHATLALGCAHDWNVAQGCLVSRLDDWLETSRRGVFVAGDGGGIGGWAAATASGEIAALGIARRLECGIDANAQRRRDGLDAQRRNALAPRALLDALYPPRRWELSDDTVVCRCEEQTAGTIRAAVRAGAPEPNAVKAATRAGMGPCQGRQCGYTVQSLIAEAQGADVADIGYFNIRPPLKPVTLGELASLDSAEDTE